MLVFLETEFTDFDPHCDLISIGMVSEDGRQFYAERSDYRMDWCSAFVKKNVLSQLGQKPDAVYDKDTLALKVSEWLSQFAHEAPTLCYDLSRDITLLRNLLGNLPKWLKTRDIRHRVEKSRIDWYIENCVSGRAHHALHDALANKFAFMPEP